MDIYRGVVEDNNSPLKDGRVKVRVFGVHTKNNENSKEWSNISTADLPWAEVIGGTDFGLISGVGISSVLRQGTWVWVTFEKGDVNYPMVIGTIKGTISETSDGKYNSGEGFCDPSGVYPKSSYVGQSDLNILSKTGYPNVSVIETHSGHKIILDDSSNKNIKIQHTSGTYIEIDKDGKLYINSINDAEVKSTTQISILAPKVKINA